MIDIQSKNQILLVFSKMFDRINSAEQPQSVLPQFSKIDPEFINMIGRW